MHTEFLGRKISLQLHYNGKFWVFFAFLPLFCFQKRKRYQTWSKWVSMALLYNLDTRSLVSMDAKPQLAWIQDFGSSCGFCLTFWTRKMPTMAGHLALAWLVYDVWYMCISQINKKVGDCSSFKHHNGQKKANHLRFELIIFFHCTNPDFYFTIHITGKWCMKIEKYDIWIFKS